MSAHASDNATMLKKLAVVACAMFGFGFALVPFYKKICEVTKADSVQAVVHCAGATTFFMSMSLGLLPQVRCVSASQVALHFRVPPATWLKAEARLPETLARLGVEYMTPAGRGAHVPRRRATKHRPSTDRRLDRRTRKRYSGLMFASFTTCL